MREARQRRARAPRLIGGSRPSILPDDPLVRWLFWLIVGVSIGAPLVVALVLALVE